MKNKVYNLIIGQETVVPAVPGVPPQGETPAVEAVPEQRSYNASVYQYRVVAIDVEEAIAKIKDQLTDGKHVESVEKVSEIDVA